MYFHLFTQYQEYILKNGKIYFKTTNKIKDPHLRWIEMRILHRILPTQKLLDIMALVDSPNYSFCQNEIKTLNHLFCECQHVKRFWNNLNKQIKTSCPDSPDLALTNDV